MEVLELVDTRAGAATESAQLFRRQRHSPNRSLTDAAKVELALMFHDIGDLGEAGG